MVRRRQKVSAIVGSISCGPGNRSSIPEYFHLLHSWFAANQTYFWDFFMSAHLCSRCGNEMPGRWKRHCCSDCNQARVKLLRGLRAPAHSAVAKAIEQGLLAKLDGSIPCKDCGVPAVVYDHREYSKPLEVDPVCKSCNLLRGPAKEIAPDLIRLPKLRRSVAA